MRRLPHTDRSWRRLVALFAIAASGCGVDPLPEPPAPDPQLVGDFDGGICTQCDGQANLSGVSGSVVDAETVWAVNLDGQAPPVVVPVKPDGSFGLFLSAVENDEVRLQARNGDARSEPIDLVMLVEGGVAPAARPFAECFIVAPELAFADTAVDHTDTRTLHLQHTCPEPLEIDRVVLRAPSSDFVVTAPTLPGVLEPGATLDLDIDFSPAGAGLREEVLLIEVSQPEVDRRPVTLSGRAP